MGTIIGLVFYALVASAKIMIVESFVYSSPETALKFSQCLIEKMSESQLFTADERNTMIEMQDVMSQALLKKMDHTDHTLFSAKLLVLSFVTSLTGVVIHEDTSKNNYRKGIYFSALEQCSLSSTGMIDTEFINEAQKILSVMEKNNVLNHVETNAFDGIRKPSIGNFGATSYSQASGMESTFPFRPSPVQNTPPPQHAFINVESAFKEQQQFPGIASSAQVAVNAPDTLQSFSQIGLPSGMGILGQSDNSPHMFHPPNIAQTGSFSSSFVSSSQNKNFPVGSGAFEIPQNEKNFEGAPSVVQPFQNGPKKEVDTSKTYNGGLNIPQTKESTVVVIPPNTNQQLTPNQHHRAEEGIYRSSSLESAPKSEISEFSKSSSVSVPQVQKSYSDGASYQVLESIVHNILMNSHTFKETFNSEISQENAVNLARSLTEQTFSGYDINTRNDALFMVTGEVAKVSVPCAENFALALSKALVYVLKQHEAALSNKQTQLATSFLSNLGSSRKFYPQKDAVVKQSQEYKPGQSPGQFHLQSESTEKQSQDYNTGQTPEQFYLQPETTEKQSQDYNTGQTIERQSQDYYASETPEEYSQPEFIQEKSQDYYTGETVDSEFNEKKTDFDFQSPPLSPEDREEEMFSISLARCLSNSEPIKNFFCDENEPEDKVKISFSIVRSSLTEYGLHVAALAASVASGALSELSKTELCDNYAKTISEVVAGILDESGVNDANAEDVAGKMELSLIQRQIAPTESQKPPSIPEDLPPRVSETETTNAPKLETSFPEEFNPHHLEKTEQPYLEKPSDDTQEDSDYTYYAVLSDDSRSSVNEQPVISSDYWITDGGIDEQALADYLTEKFHTLEMYSSEESGEEEYGDDEEETSFKTEAGTNRNSRKELRRKARRERKRKKTTTTRPEIEATSSYQYEEDIEDYYPVIITDEDTIFDQQEGEISLDNKDQPHSTVSNVKINPIELQPSFQDAVFHSKDTSVVSQHNFGKVFEESGHIHPSTIFARQVSEIAESSISYIRTQNFDMNNLCTQINKLAPIVNIPVLDNCEPVAAYDYLLNVLRSVVRTLSGV